MSCSRTGPRFEPHPMYYVVSLHRGYKDFFTFNSTVRGISTAHKN